MNRNGLRGLAPAAAALCVVVPLFAGSAAAAGRSAVTGSARDFLAGEFHGTALSATGRLTVGPALAPSPWPEEATGATVFASAADAKGRVYVATGGGQGRLFVAEGGAVRLLFTAPEPNVTAVAVAADGTVVCATSPDGKLYVVDPGSKDPSKGGAAWGSPGEAAIWSLAFGPDRSLYVGTGAKGRIYRRDPSGKLDLLYEAEDLHVRCLAPGPGGLLYAGTSDKGLVLAIQPDGKARTLYDSEKPEVTSLAVAPDGSLYAASAAADGASGGASRLDLRRAPAPTPTPTPAPSREEIPRGTVSVSTSPVRPAAAPAASGANSTEIVAIRPDGFVEPAWTLPEDVVYSMRLEGAGRLVLATGPRGRVYSLENRRLRLEAQADEKSVVATHRGAAGTAAVVSGPPGVLVEKGSGSVRSGTYVAAVKDAARLARFGRLAFEADRSGGGALAFSVRAGNSQKPDGTWSAWMPVGADGKAHAAAGQGVPAARFFQWKAELTAPDGKGGPSLERVELFYSDRNSRPVLENLAVLEPGAVFPRAGASAGPSVLSVTNPDENGIYAGIEPPKETTDAGGRKLFRKGFRTFTWKGADPNGDPLRYAVELVPATGGGPAFLLRKEVEEQYLSFDSAAVPDGRYRFRVTASDRLGNPEGEALETAEESDLFVVDNAPPAIRVESRSVEKGELVVRFVATDLLSPIAKAEGAVNADRWRLLAADDGAFDSPAEAFTLRVAVPAGPAVLAVRVVDGAGNVAALSVEYPREFAAR